MTDATALASRILMVKDQLRRRGIQNERVLDAFQRVPRENFVNPEDASKAYDDQPLNIGFGQTISQPYIVALTCQALDLSPSDRVLEIGTGSGYETAVLSHLCRQVVSMERLPELLAPARDRLRRMGITNVELVSGDGTLGATDRAPFEGIAVTAAAPAVPAPLVSQMAAGGRMVIPVGGRAAQELFLYRNTPAKYPAREKLCDCRFVPLIGQYGFDAGVS